MTHAVDGATQSTHSSRDRPRRGLVLSAGAALGAYQAGALKALKERGLDFEVISATSIGTLHALAWNMDETLLAIDEHWISNVAGLRPFDHRRIFRGENPFRFRASLDAVFDTYQDTYPESEAERLEILVTVTEYETCRPVVFSMKDEGLDEEEKISLLKASTVLPHLGMRPIELRGRHYFDGGYTDLVPVTPLAQRGLDEIWLIPLVPILRRKPTPSTGKEQTPRGAPSRGRPRTELRALVTLLDQCVRPLEGATAGTEHVLVAPKTRLKAMALFQPIHALTFSKRNIRRLLDCGYRDGLRVWEEYQRGRGHERR